MSGTIGGAKENEFIDVVLHTRFAENRARHHATPSVSDSQSIGRRRSINIVAGLPAAASRHELVNDRGISRDVFLQKRRQRLYPQVSRPAGVAAMHDSNRF